MNNSGNEKYLPIGTVVLLKGAKKRLMITGFCMISKENQSSVYDYSGCIYPEGVIKANQTALFNHDQIEKIFYIGLRDQEEIDFKTKLNEILTKQNGMNSTGSVVSNNNSVITNVNDVNSVQQNNNAQPQIFTNNVNQ